MEANFRRYTSNDKNACLALFDANCPMYFAKNEREDYNDFLNSQPQRYTVALDKTSVIGAFGLSDEAEEKHVRVDWILLDPRSQGSGLGSTIMNKILSDSKANQANMIHISTSHKSFEFFERFGATILSETEHGWGRDMHRVDMVISL